MGPRWSCPLVSPVLGDCFFLFWALPLPHCILCVLPVPGGPRDGPAPPQAVTWFLRLAAVLAAETCGLWGACCLCPPSCLVSCSVSGAPCPAGCTWVCPSRLPPPWLSHALYLFWEACTSQSCDTPHWSRQCESDSLSVLSARLFHCRGEHSPRTGCRVAAGPRRPVSAPVRGAGPVGSHSSPGALRVLHTEPAGGSTSEDAGNSAGAHEGRASPLPALPSCPSLSSCSGPQPLPSALSGGPPPRLDHTAQGDALPEGSGRWPPASARPHGTGRRAPGRQRQEGFRSAGLPAEWGSVPGASCLHCPHQLGLRP